MYTKYLNIKREIIIFKYNKCQYGNLYKNIIAICCNIFIQNVLT